MRTYAKECLQDNTRRLRAPDVILNKRDVNKRVLTLIASSVVVFS
jgi:hypothetical protein